MPGDDVWVIIPTYNAAGLVRECLRGLLPQAERKARVLVVDDASSEDFRWLDEGEFRGIVRLRLDDNRGFAGAVNAGVAEARRRGARIAIVLPNDNHVEPGWLDALLDALGPGVGAVMSWSLNEDLDPQLLNQAGTLNMVGRNVMVANLDGADGPRPVFYSSGNGVALRLDAIDPPCDVDYEAYYEDVAQGWRLRLSGYQIVVQPRARLRHQGGGTMRRYPFRRVYLAERNRLMTLLTHYGRDSIARLFPVLAIDTVLGWLSPRKALARLAAFGWTASSAPWLVRKRKQIQSARRASERRVLAFMTSRLVPSGRTAASIVNSVARLYARAAGFPAGM